MQCRGDCIDSLFKGFIFNELDSNLMRLLALTGRDYVEDRFFLVDLRGDRSSCLKGSQMSLMAGVVESTFSLNLFGFSPLILTSSFSCFAISALSKFLTHTTLLLPWTTCQADCYRRTLLYEGLWQALAELETPQSALTWPYSPIPI
jgi:hypothetical protein